MVLWYCGPWGVIPGLLGYSKTFVFSHLWNECIAHIAHSSAHLKCKELLLCRWCESRAHTPRNASEWHWCKSGLSLKTCCCHTWIHVRAYARENGLGRKEDLKICPCCVRQGPFMGVPAVLVTVLPGSWHLRDTYWNSNGNSLTILVSAQVSSAILLWLIQYCSSKVF